VLVCVLSVGVRVWEDNWEVRKCAGVCFECGCVRVGGVSGWVGVEVRVYRCGGAGVDLEEDSREVRECESVCVFVWGGGGGCD